MNSELISELKQNLKAKNFDKYSELLSKSKLTAEDFKNLGYYIGSHLNKPEDKNALKASLLKYFPPLNEDTHIPYLISKSKTKSLTSQTDENNEKLRGYFHELNDIPIIKKIFQVLQYNQDLNIIFDFDKWSISYIDPTGTENVKGRTDIKRSYIFIGAGAQSADADNKVMATIAHELTHLAMQMIFNNECNPYSANDKENESKFKPMHDLLKTQKDIDDIFKRVY